MRTITAAQEAILAQEGWLRSDHLRILVDDGSGTDVDLSILKDRDFVRSASIRESVDNQIKTATVMLWREIDHFSLVPLFGSGTTTTAGTLDIGRAIKIQTATLAADATPIDSDFITAFEGVIDGLDWGSGRDQSSMTLQCRDNSAELADTYIETIVTRGSVSPGTAAETVIQNIIDGSVSSPPTLFVPVSPSFNIIQYKQQKEPVAVAIRKITNLFGWDVRYRFDNGTSSFRLTLVEPDRLSPTVVRTFNEDQYYAVTQANLSRLNIRNRIQIVFMDPTTDPPTRVTVTREDIPSQTKYSKFFMEIVEGATSQIDTTPEAEAMADAILSDLEEPNITHSVDLPYFFAVQLGDFYTFTKNNVHYDTDQSLAVVGYQHTFTPDKKFSTVLETRGVPSAGVMRWLDIEGRPGMGPNADNFIDVAPQNTTVTVGVGSIIIDYQDPRINTPPLTDWGTTRMHLEQGAGPVTPSAANLVAEGKVTHFEVSNLTPGDTFSVTLVLFDLSGNESATISINSIKTQKTAAFHLNEDTEYGRSVIPNSEFGAFTFDRDTNPPDAWVPRAPAIWANTANNFFFETVTALSSQAALKIVDDPVLPGSIIVSNIDSDLFVVSENQLYMAQAFFRRDTGDATGQALLIDISWFDEDKVILGLGNIITRLTGQASGNGWVLVAGALPEAQPESGWFMVRRYFKPAAAGTRFGRVVITKNRFTTGLDKDINIDAVYLVRVRDLLRSNLTSNQLIVKNTFVTLTAVFSSEDRSGSFSSNTWTAPRDMRIRVSTGALSSTLSIGKFLSVRGFLNGTTAVARGVQVERASNFSSVDAQGEQIIAVSQNDTIVLQAKHNGTGSETITGNERTYLNIEELVE